MQQQKIGIVNNFWNEKGFMLNGSFGIPIILLYKYRHVSLNYIVISL